MTKEKTGRHKDSCFKTNKEIICQICQKDLEEDPHTLCCYQNFCGECLMKVDKLTTKTCTYDKCSTCEIFSSNQEKSSCLITTVKNGMEIICNYDFVKQLSHTRCTCFDCMESKTTAYCIHCESHLCEACQFQHMEKEASKDHQVIAKVSDFIVINVTLFCPDHPNTPCQLYCTDCQRVMCTLCQNGEHNMHEITTTKLAFGTCISDVKDEFIKLRSACELAKEICKIVKMVNRSTRENYNKVLKQAREKMEKEIHASSEMTNQVAKLKTDYETLESSLLSNRRLKGGEQIQEHLQHEIDCMERLCTWVNVLTSVTQGPGTLHELESKLREKIKNFASETNNLSNAKQYLTNMPEKAKFIHSQDNAVNKIGHIEFLPMGQSFTTKPGIISPKVEDNSLHIENEEVWLNKSYRVSSLDFKTLAKKKASLANVMTYKRSVIRICIFANYIWCAPACNNVTCIDIYDLNCQFVKTIGWNRVINVVNSLHPLTANEILIAANNGLFVMEAKTGSITDQILPGVIKDVQSCGDKIAALEKDNDTIHVLSSAQPYIPIAGFCLTTNQAKSLLLHNQYIYISLGSAGSSIIKYTLGGEQVSQINNASIALSCDEPFKPYLGMADEYGSLLVTDGPNNRILVVQEGECVVIQGIEITYPRDVVIDKGYMYVSRLSKLHKYKLTPEDFLH